MFTGIIEALGRVAAVTPRGSASSLEVEAPELVAGTALGASIALNGCCLTVAALSAAGFRFEAVAETLSRTNLGELRPGCAVNLERALRVDGRLDGHFVQGHVDGVGRVASLERRGEDVRLAVDCDEAVAALLVEKGSVAVDGVSLTVVGVGRAGFDVALIPYTLAHTTLGERGPGSRVNLEADVLGKYVKSFLARIRR